MTSTKRLRIFAGPNGSGKSTLIKLVKDLDVQLGVYVNADDIKMEIDSNHFLNFNRYTLTLNLAHLKTTLSNTSFYVSPIGDKLSVDLTELNNCLYIKGEALNDNIFPLFLADYIRMLLLNTCDKFTFETVMSHSSKLEYIRQAKRLGYRVYLYFVSLEDPILNIARVEARVKQGGHDVPTDKIINRYERTMNFLLDAIKLVDRAYLFDNSSTHPKLFAKSQNNEITLVDSVYVPIWFEKYVINKL